MSRRQLTPPHNEVQNVFFHTLTPLLLFHFLNTIEDLYESHV